MNRWLILIAVGFLAACGGGGGGGSSTPAVLPTATPTPYNGPAPASAATTIPANGSLSQALPSVAGYGGSIVATITSGIGSAINASVSLGPLPAVAEQPAITTYTNAPVQVLDYADFVVSGSAVLEASTTLTMSFPAGTLLPNTSYYYAFWPGNAQTPNWIDTSGGRFPVNTIDPVGQTITIVASPNLTFQPGFVYGFAIYR